MWARAVFAGYLGVAYLVLVFGPPADGSYFLLDDWQTLADVSAPFDVHYQHNGHWYLGPLLIVKVLYAVFGITTFTPYLMAEVGIHIGIVVLLRVVMRRAGVGSWTSTATAASMAVFSATELNLFWLSYDYSFGAAVLSGLGYVLVATAPGRRRAWVDALAVAVYELVSRSRWAVLLLVPMLVTGPVHAADLGSEGLARVADGSRVFLPAATQWPAAESLPDWVRPDRGYAGRANPITLGWLRQAQAGGRLSASLPIEGAVEDELRIRLGVQPIDPSWIADTGTCRDLDPGESIDVDAAPGEGLLVRTGRAGGAVVVRHRDPRAPGQVWQGSGPNLPFAVGFLLPDLPVSVSPAPLQELGSGEPEAVTVCTGMFRMPP